MVTGEPAGAGPLLPPAPGGVAAGAGELLQPAPRVSAPGVYVAGAVTL